MKLKGLKKAIGDYKRANAEGKYSPSYGRLMLDKESGEIWTDCFYDIGHNSWKEYHSKSVIDIGRLVGREYEEVNMKTVQAYVEKHYGVTEKKSATSVLKFSHIDNYLNLKTEGVKISYNSTNYDIIESKKVEDLRLFVAKTNIPEVYVYGAIQLKDNFMHKAGYVWSSRVGILNKNFNSDYVQVIINNSAMYTMRVSEASKYLPDGYEYVKEIKYDNEPTYIIQKTK